jgi:hypothetical protein
MTILEVIIFSDQIRGILIILAKLCRIKGDPPMAEKNISNWVKYMALGSTIATALAGLVGGGYLLGNFLDTRLGTDLGLRLF